MIASHVGLALHAYECSSSHNENRVCVLTQAQAWSRRRVAIEGCKGTAIWRLQLPRSYKETERMQVWVTGWWALSRSGFGCDKRCGLTTALSSEHGGSSLLHLAVLEYDHLGS